MADLDDLLNAYAAKQTPKTRYSNAPSRPRSVLLTKETSEETPKLAPRAQSMRPKSTSPIASTRMDAAAAPLAAIADESAASTPPGPSDRPQSPVLPPKSPKMRRRKDTDSTTTPTSSDPPDIATAADIAEHRKSAGRLGSSSAVFAVDPSAPPPGARGSAGVFADDDDDDDTAVSVPVIVAPSIEESTVEEASTTTPTPKSPPASPASNRTNTEAAAAMETTVEAAETSQSNTEPEIEIGAETEAKTDVVVTAPEDGADNTDASESTEDRAEVHDDFGHMPSKRAENEHTTIGKRDSSVDDVILTYERVISSLPSSTPTTPSILVTSVDCDERPDDAPLPATPTDMETKSEEAQDHDIASVAAAPERSRSSSDRPSSSSVVEPIEKLSQYLTVSVCDPRVLNDTEGKPYTDFGLRVRSDIPSFRSSRSHGVRRRYVEFQWLRDSLAQAGILPCDVRLPELVPDDDDDEPTTDADVEDDRRRLELFLAVLAADHTVREHPGFQRFLRSHRPESHNRLSTTDTRATSWLATDEAALLELQEASANPASAAAPESLLDDVPEEETSTTEATITAATAAPETVADASAPAPSPPSTEEKQSLASELGQLSLEQLRELVLSKGMKVPETLTMDEEAEMALLIAQVLANADVASETKEADAASLAKHATGASSVTWSKASQWDPSPLLAALYGTQERQARTRKPVNPAPSPAMQRLSPSQRQRVEERERATYAGYMDKLATGKRTATIFNGWKRRWFELRDGKLCYYKELDDPMVLGSVPVHGATIRVSATNGTIEILRRGDTLIMLRCDSASGLVGEWHHALEEMAQNGGTFDVSSKVAAMFRPTAPSMPTIVIDAGSCDVKAGVISVESTAPSVVFPTVYATTNATSSATDPVRSFVGSEALRPAVRRAVHTSNPLDPRTVYDLDALEDIWAEVFSALDVEPNAHGFVLTAPQHNTYSNKKRMAEIMFETYRAPKLFIQSQAVLAMYSYGKTSGIVVDVGDRTDVVPLIDGFNVSGGEQKLQIGGKNLTDHFARLLSESGYRFFSPVESYIVRYLKEKMCYVSMQPQRELEDATRAKDKGETPLCQTTLDISQFAVPDGTQEVTIDTARFRVAEGFFDPNLYGKDNVGVHHLVAKALNACPHDSRKDMARNICVSGGAVQMPGFAERLQREVQQLVHSSLAVQVHSQKECIYAAYRGAGIVAGLNSFDEVCLWRDEYDEQGYETLVEENSAW